MTSNYADPDTQMGGGPGPYGNHNGTPPAQQQHQDLTDPDLQLQEKLQQFSNQVMHSSGPQQPQYQQPAQMTPMQGAHPHFQPPQRPTHSPQQMAHVAMSLGEHPHEQFDPNDPNRKRSKVSRACDECRRKKVSVNRKAQVLQYTYRYRFDVTRPARTGQKPARAAREQEQDVNSAGSQ